MGFGSRSYLLAFINMLNQQTADALNLFLRSYAYEFLGETEEAKIFMQKAKAKDYNVIIQAMYESSFLQQEKFAME